MLLQYVDCPFVRVGTIVVCAAAFFDGKRLFDTAEHVGVVLQILIVIDKATFPKRRYGLYTLELVRFLPFVSLYG